MAGALLCVLSLGGTVLLLGGIASGAYWAIAIPAAMFVVLVMGTLLWVGWTFIMSEGAPSVPRPQRPGWQ